MARQQCAGAGPALGISLLAGGLAVVDRLGDQVPSRSLRGLEALVLATFAREAARRSSAGLEARDRVAHGLMGQDAALRLDMPELADAWAALVASEVTLRWTLPSYHSVALPEHMIRQHTDEAGFKYDPDLMWYWKTLPIPKVGMNSHGFRRREAMTRTKPAGITRVITFGDSQTHGGGVEAEETFSYYAEQELGDQWEVLNSGLSGYRSLNIFRMMRKMMPPFQADIYVVNCMVFDSPAEDGMLHQEAEGNWQHRLREATWNSRLNFVLQLALRRAGWGVWEDLPWPIHLHKVREGHVPKPGLRFGLGNHDQIGRWATERGTQVVFMEYPYRTGDNELDCQSWAADLPKGYPIFPSCSILQSSNVPPEELFIDSNHLTPRGNQILGRALGNFLRDL